MLNLFLVIFHFGWMCVSLHLVSKILFKLQILCQFFEILVRLPFTFLDAFMAVDSIRWVRSDSIVVGCFQQTEDGMEKNYFIQVITSKDGKIIDVSSPNIFSALSAWPPAICLGWISWFSNIVLSIFFVHYKKGNVG